jgi:hypothetical protein
VPPRGLHLTTAFILLPGWMKWIAPARERLEWLFKNELSLSLSSEMDYKPSFKI